MRPKPGPAGTTTLHWTVLVPFFALSALSGSGRHRPSAHTTWLTCPRLETTRFSFRCVLTEKQATHAEAAAGV